ncbi:hypothetical protein J1605_010121 [Eschrichtius robustus]|uniref:DOC domain-containing protein n=1 Tax=Eschrichtius robustus TaxID=9764 RepID=A0AB34GSX8_ESCRO|nr:hypothetical protein J1605_010121 [Eschrichtius robustus]
MAAKAIFVSPGGGGGPQWQRAESAGGKREASPALGGARAPAVPAVSPKPAATSRRRLHRRHLRPNQRLWENVPKVCRPWQTTAKGQTLPGYSPVPENLSGGKPGLRAVSAWAFPVVENGSSLSRRVLFPNVNLLLRSRFPQSWWVRNGFLAAAYSRTSGRGGKRNPQSLVQTLLVVAFSPWPQLLNGVPTNPLVKGEAEVDTLILCPLTTIVCCFAQLNIFKMTTPNKTPPGADPKQLERTGTVREIGSQAVWSLSSCKPGKTKQNKNAVRNNC